RVHDADNLRVDQAARGGPATGGGLRGRGRLVVLRHQPGQPRAQVVDAERRQVVRPGRHEHVVTGHDRGPGDHVEVGCAVDQYDVVRRERLVPQRVRQQPVHRYVAGARLLVPRTAEPGG